ncbi:UDP-N-acetylhexosamine pyrophosphorylase [Cephus cinctus]|uniref:UDP-N-acetylglucosamine diphosphorylase n=1 Tax=Cephus cinctus TaxID=211228 RepID=A0AAJ7C0S9_CEPCN|nr:UDP-N-acetylhexosamine pyrophosphorylase [Cephus cinctus]XP_015598687.1 UDP-N-acetylhexosamine pyrophosphorylase [Cephus cinctus]
MDEESAQFVLQRYGQEHLLQFWTELSMEEKKIILKDISEVNFSEVTSYFKKATSSSKDIQKNFEERLCPIPDDAIDSFSTSTAEKLHQYMQLGLEEIANGRVAVLLMAGGQGTRLGVNYPKGIYDVGLPSHKTLLHLQAERIRRLQEIAEQAFGKSGEITWYVLTSEATQKPTLDYFRENKFFGLKEENVVTFEQGMLPCFTFNGQIILDEKYKLSRAPDGNGGVYRALKVQGILNDMEKRGIRSVHAHSVDNILVKVADPVFLGYCLSHSADCGVKVVKKSSPTEAVGVVCQVDNEYKVVEYSEITKKMAERRRSDGNLVLNAGNICNHYFTVEFLRAVGDIHEGKLDLHVAKKKIPYVDENGIRVLPNVVNGIKIEKFVFDVFRFARKFVAWEVVREYEFSALKNADSSGQDCPTTARQDVFALHKKWLLDAGAECVSGDVEISPLLSYAGENLENIAKGKVFKGPTIVQ